MVRVGAKVIFAPQEPIWSLQALKWYVSLRLHTAIMLPVCTA
jgi:hypothetical protein